MRFAMSSSESGEEQIAQSIRLPIGQHHRCPPGRAYHFSQSTAAKAAQVDPRGHGIHRSDNPRPSGRQREAKRGWNGENGQRWLNASKHHLGNPPDPAQVQCGSAPRSRNKSGPTMGHDVHQPPSARGKLAAAMAMALWFPPGDTDAPNCGAEPPPNVAPVEIAVAVSKAPP